MDNKQYAQKLVRELGVPTHLKGYTYLTEAICAAAKENIGMEELYQQVAERNETTACRVERAIRHSIELLHYGKYESFSEVFGSEKCPGNEEFIVFFAGKMKQ